MKNEDRNRKRITAAEVLSRYNAEDIPDFVGKPLTDVNQAGSVGNRPIHLASHRGNIDDVIALVDAGAQVNVVGDMGYTPLHEAAEYGHVEVVRFLLEHGGDVNVENEFGMTPLDLAMRNGHSDVVNLLEESTEDI